MEPKVEIRCLKSDVQKINGVLKSAVQKFKDLILKECEKTFDCEVFINEDKPLDLFDKDRFY